MGRFTDQIKAVPPELEIMVGMSLDEATEFATSKGLVVRILELDGEPYSLEYSFHEERVNFRVAKGVVIEVGLG